MANYFSIELDTTEPTLEINTPPYIIVNNPDIITIESNEDVSDYQNIYLLDKNNIKYNLVFAKVNSKELLGTISLDNSFNGDIELFVQLEDTVGNLSELIIQKIRVFNSNGSLELKLETDERIMMPKTDGKEIANVNLRENEMEINEFITIHDIREVCEWNSRIKLEVQSS